MVVDYEAAWHEMQALIASKTQHGREQTLVAMTSIAERNRVPAGELSRLLRLYGVEVERARAAAAETDRAGLECFAGGFDSPGDTELAGLHGRGGHDGSRSGNGSAVGSS